MKTSESVEAAGTSIPQVVDFATRYRRVNPSIAGLWNTNSLPFSLTGKTLPRRTEKTRRAHWTNGVQDLYHAGFITEPLELAENVYACTETGYGFGACARELACNLTGQIWPGKRSVSWVSGRDGPHGRLFDIEDVPRIMEAQKLMQAVGADTRMPWSIGRIAKALVEWAVLPESCPIHNDHLLDGIPGGYHDCKPGYYPDHGTPYIYDPKPNLFADDNMRVNPDYRPGATMYDVSSYYYALLCRAQSIRLDAGKRLYWGTMTQDERVRWGEMLEAVASVKLLRNALVGCAMGAKGRRPVYSQDKTNPGTATRKMINMKGGPFRGLGLLILRTGYELCLTAAMECDSIYSTVDSVTTLEGVAPKIWRSVGLRSEVKYSGHTVINARGNWQCGPFATIPYQEGFTNLVPVPRATPPEREYYREWL